MAVTDFQDILSRFDVVKKTGKGFLCKCPCSANHKHKDKKPSLYVWDAGNKASIQCYANCSIESICSAVGLEVSNIYYQKKEQSYKKASWITYIENKVTEQEGQKEKYVKHWNHIYKDGSYACSKVKFLPKTFRYAVFKNSDHTNISLGLYINGKKIDRCDMAAFYSPDYPGFKKAVAEGQTVHFTEGEKNADVLNKYGYKVVTCGGSNDWNSGVSEIFTGAKRVVIWQDNDPAGEKLANQVYRDLVKIVDDVQIVKPCPEVRGGDAADLVALHGVKSLHRVARFDKYQFHMFTEKEDKKTGEITRKISGVFDYEIFKYLTLTRSILVCGQVVYMYQDGIFVPDISGAKLKTAIRELIFPPYIKSNTIRRVFDLFLSADELQTVPEDFNKQPDSWVCFQNGYYDPINKKLISHNPKYQTINQLPHEYHPAEKPKGELIESWLKDVMGADEMEMILQYAGYCCTTDITQQKYMIINGIGGTGKSTLINLMEIMIGCNNVSGVALDELSHRFVGYDLMWKLLNSNADLKIDVLDDASTVKKISGEDTIKGEAKGKQPVYFKSYAKHIFSTNQMPVIKEERSDAFYRRLLILPMNKKPEKQDPTFSKRLKEEIDYFIHLCMDALGRLYESGLIHIAESSVSAVKQLREDSDVTQAFINAKIDLDNKGKISRSQLYTEFESFCKGMERQSLNRTNFFKAIRAKGFTDRKIHGDYYFWGMVWKSGDSPQGFMKVSDEEIQDLGWM